MKIRTKTIKGLTNTQEFVKNYNKFIDELDRQGFKEIELYETLHGKHAKEKVIIYAWLYVSELTVPTREVYTICYR